MKSRTALLVLLCLVFAVPSANALGIALIPEQIHVTIGQEPGTLVIQWAVAGEDYGPQEAPIVEWSVGGGAMSVTQAARAGVVRSGLALGPEVPISTYVYAATIGPIAFGAMVDYAVGSEARGMSPLQQVRMVPAPLSSSLRFVAYGDIGLDGVALDGSREPNTASPPFDVRDLAISLEPDLVVIPGDLPYDNQRTGWDAFMRFMQPLAARVPVMPTVGNHEWEARLGYEQFRNSFVLPGDEMSYAFQAGPATFIAFNSDNLCKNHSRGTTGTAPRPCEDGQGGAPNEELLRWLEATLQAAQTDSTPWTVVFHHHPPFSHGRHGSDWAAQELLAPLYETYGVDLVITAHDHLYGRSFPIQDRRPVVDDTNVFTKGLGPTYAVLGGGGRALYAYPSTGAPEWHAVGESVHHLAKIDIDDTGLHFQAIRSGDKSLLDEFWIVPEGSVAETTTPERAPGPSILGALAAFLVAGILRLRGEPPLRPN